MSEVQYLVFDNDGVNIDSEDLAMRIMEEAGYALVVSHGGEIEAGHIYSTYAGTSTDAIVRKLIDNFGLDEAKVRETYGVPEGQETHVYIADIITLDTIERFSRELTATPNVTAALEELRDTYGAENIALATTSRQDRMDVSLEHAIDSVTRENARLHEFFPEGERRRSGYGHPNKYDEAFGALGWDPSKSVVIEDSRSGVQKARAHHPDVRVIGTVAAKFFEDKSAQASALLEDGASLVISNMGDLPKAVAWLATGMDPKQMPEFSSKIFVPQNAPAPGTPKIDAPALRKS